MNQRKVLGIFAFLLLVSQAGAVMGQGLRVVIKGVKNAKGTVRVALYRTEEQFMKVIWRSEEVSASKGEVEVEFNDLPTGTFALSVVHDANNNEKLDMNGMGIPQEGFGFSNNARGRFGPPGWKEAKWAFDGTKGIEIELYYY